MEQLMAVLMAYSSWIFWGILVLNLILLTTALHRMRKLRKQMKQVSLDIKKLLESTEKETSVTNLQTLKVESESAVKTESADDVSNTLRTETSVQGGDAVLNDYIRGGQQVPLDSKNSVSSKKEKVITETPEKILNAVLEEVFP